MRTPLKVTTIVMLASLASFSFSTFMGHKSDIIYHPEDSQRNARLPIDVSNMTDLYKEVNNPANAGATIRLVADTYKLDATLSPATAGRLEFQKDMSIIGYVDFTIASQDENRPSVIDASKLPKTSFKPTGAGQPGRTGCIRMGRGHNTLSFVTLIGNPNTEALSGIDTDLDYKNPVVEISHCVVMNSQQGIDIRNAAANGMNRKLTAFIHNNVLTKNLVDIGHQGLSIQNANGADKSKIKVFMSNNRIFGNPFGMRVMNVNVINDTIEIISNGDKFDEHQTALIFWAGQQDMNVAGSRAVLGNVVSFISYDIHIGHNQPVPNEIVYGPVFAVAGNTKFLPNMSNSNSLELAFYSPDFEKNFNTINVFGARNEANLVGGPNAGLAGKLNKVSICTDNNHIKIKSKSSDVNSPGNNNKVTIVKCPTVN